MTIDPRNPPEYIYRVPAYYRSRVGRMEPRVAIGILRDPVAPIRISSSVHRPPAPRPRRAWRIALAAAALLVFTVL